MDSQDLGLKDLLSTHDAIHDLYSNQIKGLLSDNSSPEQAQQTKHPVSAEGSLGAAGTALDAYDMYKEYENPNTHGMQKTNNMLKIGGNNILGTAAGYAAEAAIPGLGPVVAGGLLAYNGISAMGDILQKNGFHGLLR